MTLMALAAHLRHAGPDRAVAGDPHNICRKLPQRYGDIGTVLHRLTTATQHQCPTDGADTKFHIGE